MLTRIGNNLEFFAEIRVQLAYANSVSIKLSEYASDFRRKILPQNVTIVNRFLKIYIFVKQKTLPVRHTGGFVYSIFVEYIPYMKVIKWQ